MGTVKTRAVVEAKCQRPISAITRDKDKDVSSPTALYSRYLCDLTRK